MTQLLLFPESTEERLTRELKELKISLDKIRKGQYAKLGAATKMAQEALRKIEILESHICKGYFNFI